MQNIFTVSIDTNDSDDYSDIESLMKKIKSGIRTTVPNCEIRINIGGKKLMKIEIIEKCVVDNSNNENETEGLRHVAYISAKNTLLEALEDYEKNFDPDNMADTYDEFDGECQDSKVIEAKIVEAI